MTPEQLSKYKSCNLLSKGITLLNNGTTRPCCFFGDVKTGLDSMFSVERHYTLIDQSDIETCCSHCINIEENGGNHSMRIESSKWGSPKLSVALSNICNLSCVTCSETASSKVLAERFKLKEISEVTNATILSCNSLTPHKIQFIIDAVNDFNSRFPDEIVLLEILGGEPSVDPRVAELLDVLINNGLSRGITVCISTNGSKPFAKLAEYARLFHKIIISMSVDGTDSIFEYLRYGAKWETVNSTLAEYIEIANSTNAVTLGFNFTLSWMNAVNFFDFLNWVENIDCNITAHLSKVNAPAKFSADCLSSSTRALLLDKAHAYVPCTPVSKILIEKYIEALQIVTINKDLTEGVSTLCSLDLIRGNSCSKILKDVGIISKDTKLVGLGDSFMRTSNRSWINVTGEQLNVPVINLGCCGSALNFSLNEFIKYINSSQFSPSDIFVFVTTSANRIYTKDMPDPMLGVGWCNAVLSNLPANSDSYKWVIKNFDHILWTVENVYNYAINTELITAMSFLKTWANANPTNVVVLLHAFDKCSELSKSLFHIITATENFLPLIAGPSLSELSIKEITNDYTLQMDCRDNHFSDPNFTLLGKMVAEVIQYKDISKYDTTQFKSDLYLNYEELLQKVKNA